MNSSSALLSGEQEQDSTAAGPRPARNALVIDDDEFVCGAIAQQLRELGVGQVITSSGGNEAVRLLNQGGPFDLIVTDLAMPSYDGLQLTRLIAVRQPRAAVLYMSAAGPKMLAAAKSLAAGRGLRVLGSLSKPVRIAELRNAVLGQHKPDAAPPAEAGLPADHAPLVRMIDRLMPLQPLQKELGAVRAQALGKVQPAELAQAADQLGSLVHRHCVQLEAERAGVVRLLDQMTFGLDEMSGYLSNEAASRREALDESRALSSRLLGEVTDLDADIQSADDLSALQEDVRTRLDRINASLQEAKQREDARLQEFEQRAAQMNARIDHLESETRTLRESVAREHQAACTDRLTGVPNRLAYDQRVRQDHASWKRYGQPMIIAVWDIDRFKKVNDTYGHACGDKALAAVGLLLSKHIRETDFVARYGGEEFAMILHGLDAEAAHQLTDKLRATIEKIDFRYNQQPVPLTVSCGYASFSGDDTPESVFERADAALYRAKNEGR
ncbi:MAG TPA: diguanylate cyclase, partial [Nevskiaceae bacterium]|nr:diguanylate cyclase [Nevskiaceae bacterium]